MRIQPSLFSLVSLSTLPSLISASGFDCAHLNPDGVKYNLSPLGGTHSIYHVEEQDQYVVNTTYVLNICNILKGAANRGPLKCGTSKNICGFEYKNAIDGSESETRAFPIVGLDPVGHGSKDPEITRLKKMDSDREGLLVKLWGGQYIDDKKAKKDAGAEIEFQCDPTRSGLEGVVENEDTQMETMDNNGTDSGSLQFKSFGPAGDNAYVLKLDWKTRYACDDYLGSKKGDSSGHWGFFTWFIVILFLCVAAYLIFGSWLNYNRYGARGWDLLPHGDTLRDVPYIFQDWLRRVVNTFQGSGSRAGYSAV